MELLYCGSTHQVRENPSWASEHALPTSAKGTTSAKYFTQPSNNASAWKGNGTELEVVDASSPNGDILVQLGKPGVATHVLSATPGQVIEIVVQNNRAGAFGGEYGPVNGSTTGRNGREQHPFHLHGYHFWVVGSGLGAWAPEKVGGSNGSWMCVWGDWMGCVWVG